MSCALAQFRLKGKETNGDASIFSLDILKLCLPTELENTEVRLPALVLAFLSLRERE